MEKNIGNTDRALRIIVGIAIIVLGILYQSWWGLVGLIPLVTAFVRWCPLYAPCGITTRKSKPAN